MASAHHARSDETVTGLAPSPTIDPKQAGENPRRCLPPGEGFDFISTGPPVPDRADENPWLVQTTNWRNKTRSFG